MSGVSDTVAERRRKVFVGELPGDFLRLTIPSSSGNDGAQQSAQEQIHPAQYPVMPQQSFVPPNTRGRISVTILEANLVKNYGLLVRMDPYCRLRVGHSVFETQTKLSGGRNPVWNRTVHAYLPVGVESIYLQIFDEKAFSADECIAWAHVLLPQAIFTGETIDEYYHLSGQQGEGKEGMLHLVLSFAPLEAPILPEQIQQMMANQAAGGALPQPQPAHPVVITDEDIKDLADMFPNIDKEVIKCILEERRGNKDATVSALLELTKTE